MSEVVKPTVAVLNRHPIAKMGGAERFSLEVSRRLAEKYDITYFAHSWEEMPEGVKLHKVPKATKKRLRWVNQLWYAIYTGWHTRKGFDIVHSHEFVWRADIHTIHCPPVKNKLTKPRPWWRKALTYLAIATSLRQMTYFGLERAQFRFKPCKKVVGVSQLTLDEMRVNYPKAEPMFEVVLPGLTAHEVPSQAFSREQWQLPKGEKILLLVANDFRWKGLDTLLEAMARLSDKPLLLVAGGGDIDHYSQRVKQIGLHGRVKFLGQQKDLASLYPAADILVHPTRADTFAMVVLEAMYAGVATIVSAEKYCGISASLKDGEALFLEDPYDEKDLAKKLEQLLDSPVERQALALKGQAFARAHTWDITAQQFDALYQAVLDCKRNA